MIQEYKVIIKDATRAKSLSKMLHIVENERFTVEIDSENAILVNTLAFQINILVAADSDKLPKI